MHATYNITNNRLKLYIERRLDDQEYKAAKLCNFQWWPGQKCFSAVWTPQGEDFILNYCQIEEDDTPDDLEARVNRFQKYAESDEQAAEDAAQRANNATTARRAESAQKTAVNKMEEAAYWNRRIAGAIATAQHKERRDVIARRIKGLQADQRKQEKLKKENEYFLKLWTMLKDVKPELVNEYALKVAGVDYVSAFFPPEKYPRSTYAGEQGIWGALEKSIITPEQAQEIAIKAHTERLETNNRWINHLTMLIDYETAYINSLGGNPADQTQNIKKGDYVMYRGEKCQVLNVGKANLRILIPSNHWQKNGALVGREKLQNA